MDNNSNNAGASAPASPNMNGDAQQQQQQNQQNQQPLFIPLQQPPRDDSRSVDDISLGSLDSEDPLVGRDLMTEDLARRETRAVSRLRDAVLSVLLIAAVVTSGRVYQTTRQAQVQSLQTVFADLSGSVMHTWQDHVQRRWAAANVLAVDLRRVARTMQAKWPAVCVPDFSTAAASTRRLLQEKDGTVLWFPIVTNDTRTLWEEFALQHAADWMQPSSSSAAAADAAVDLLEKDASKARLNSAMLLSGTPISQVTAIERRRRLQGDGVVSAVDDDPPAPPAIAPHIFDQNGAVTGPGPYAPLWQTAPIPAEIAEWVNFNLLSLPALQGGLQAVLQQKLPVWEQAVDYTYSYSSPSSSSSLIANSFPGQQEPAEEEEDEAESAAVSALFTSFAASTSTSIRQLLSAADAAAAAGGTTTTTKTEPASPLLYPIFANNDEINGPVVGVVTLINRWSVALMASRSSNGSGGSGSGGSSSTAVPAGKELMTVVLENACGQVFTFRISNAPASSAGAPASSSSTDTVVEYVGPGDLHPTFDTKQQPPKRRHEKRVEAHCRALHQQTTLQDAFFQANSDHQKNADNNDNDNDDDALLPNLDYCPWTLHVYPSQPLCEVYITDPEPLVRTAMVFSLFVMAALVFTIYDCLVSRRQKVVMDHAMHSSAIVSSLFPEQVRDRLFRRNSNTFTMTMQDLEANAGASSHGGEDQSRDDSSFVLFEPAKARLRTFLDHHHFHHSNSGDEQPQHTPTSHAIAQYTPPFHHRSSSMASNGVAAHHHSMSSTTAVGLNTNNPESRPIADLFPHCTVLFADISGFTAWSSLRDPAQVFMLLESVYHTFDKIARKRGVFKVETVGDSYVAVTGLPDPQEDHAVIMCRFARDCRAKMNEATRKLELTLGPDTGELKMRFGMHSGPVTAGVLRGEKSRFQLFGDTVNTAARMESTGERDKIQLSAATADLITKAGKGYWIRPREKLVHAKGKGDLQTYWFEPSNSRRSISSVATDDSLTNRTTSSVLWGEEPLQQSQDEYMPEMISQRSKHLRLIDYNVDLLASLLRQVVARRRVLDMSKISEEAEAPAILPTKQYKERQEQLQLQLQQEQEEREQREREQQEREQQEQQRFNSSTSNIDDETNDNSNENDTSENDETTTNSRSNSGVVNNQNREDQENSTSSTSASSISTSPSPLQSSSSSSSLLFSTSAGGVDRSNMKGSVMEEVTEVIKLPGFDAAAFKGYVDPDSIELGAKVLAQLKRYVTIIAAMYRSNPFHNFEHASHVTMSVNKLLQRVVTPDIRIRRRSLRLMSCGGNANGTNNNNGEGGGGSGCLGGSQQIASDLHHYTYGITSDPLTQLAVVFAALIHDVDHWGVSNLQLVKEGVPIAAKYHNQSIAEQNSVDLAWDLLMDEEEYGDLLRCLFRTQDEYKRFRQVVVNVVMATDIFDAELCDLRKKRWDKVFNSSPEARNDDPDFANRKATIVIEHIMQASDVAHTMQHWHVYQKWNRRLFDELYTAYKAGRMERDPATFWVDGELRFFDTYVIPLAKKLKDCAVFGVASEECLNYAANNRSEWAAKGPRIVEELVANYHQREKEESEKAKKIENDHEKKKRQRFARRRSLFTSGG